MTADRPLKVVHKRGFLHVGALLDLLDPLSSVRDRPCLLIHKFARFQAVLSRLLSDYAIVVVFNDHISLLLANALIDALRLHHRLLLAEFGMLLE